MHNTGMEPEAVGNYCELGNIRARFAKFTVTLGEEILMHNTGMEPEAVEIYCEVGAIRALGAKFTIKKTIRICRRA